MTLRLSFTHLNKGVIPSSSVTHLNKGVTPSSSVIHLNKGMTLHQHLVDGLSMLTPPTLLSSRGVNSAKSIHLKTDHRASSSSTVTHLNKGVTHASSSSSVTHLNKGVTPSSSVIHLNKGMTLHQHLVDGLSMLTPPTLLSSRGVNSAKSIH